MKTLVKIWLWAVIIISIATLTASFCNAYWQNEAVWHKAAHYDYWTGDWRWNKEADNE